MKKIVFTKIVLIIFLGSFQNILSQSKKIDEINQSISYWENDYSYEDYISSNDRSICQSSLGYRGIIRGFTKIGVRKYDVVFFNVVNSEYGRVTIDYSDKPIPSEDEYKNYITNQINSLKNDIESENERLLIIEKRRLLAEEEREKLNNYISSEKKKIKIRMDSLLNEITYWNKYLFTYHQYIISVDKIFDEYQSVWKKDTLFGVNKWDLVKHPDEFISSLFKGYDEFEDSRQFQVITEYEGTESPILKESNSYYFKKTYKKSRVHHGFKTRFFKSMLKFLENAISESGRTHAESFESLNKFFQFIEKERWDKIVDRHIQLFNVSDVDTTGFKDKGIYKWINRPRDHYYHKNYINRTFLWYEKELKLIEKEGFNYINYAYSRYIPLSWKSFIEKEFGRIYSYQTDFFDFKYYGEDGNYTKLLEEDLTVFNEYYDYVQNSMKLLND